MKHARKTAQILPVWVALFLIAAPLLFASTAARASADCDLRDGYFRNHFPTYLQDGNHAQLRKAWSSPWMVQRYPSCGISYDEYYNLAGSRTDKSETQPSQVVQENSPTVRHEDPLDCLSKERLIATEKITNSCTFDVSLKYWDKKWCKKGCEQIVPANGYVIVEGTVSPEFYGCYGCAPSSLQRKISSKTTSDTKPSQNRTRNTPTEKDAEGLDIDPSTGKLCVLVYASRPEKFQYTGATRYNFKIRNSCNKSYTIKFKTNAGWVGLNSVAPGGESSWFCTDGAKSNKDCKGGISGYTY